MTMIEWLCEWLDIYKTPYLTRGSVERLEGIIRLHVPAWLKVRELENIRALDVDRAVSACKAPRTRKYLYFTLRNALRKAYCVDLIQTDITTKMESVRYRAKTGRALTVTEQARFLEKAKDSKYINLFKFYLLTGVRRSEALNLQWSDIDLELRQIHIKGTKTESSDRIVYILPELADALEEQRKATGTGALVFPYDKTNVSHAFHRLCPDHHLHDLRHTFVTRCAESGININVAQQLAGHSDISTTVNNQYGHTKSKLELKQSNQCKSESRDSLRNLDFLST